MKSDYSWKPPVWLKEPQKRTVIFQNRPIETYLGKVAVSEIKLWRENDRTLLDIEHVSQFLNKPEEKIEDEVIIDYILKQGVHHISDLAESIKRNGVRIPLTLTYKKELLDGNRRFLACCYLLKREKETLPNYAIVPAYCLQPHLSKRLKNTILAEMNFLDNLKEPWPRAVRAQFAVNLFNELKKEFGEAEALNRITNELKLTKNDLDRFRDVLSIIGEYQRYKNKETEKSKEEIETFTREKFHFFEEFYNKCIVKELKNELGDIKESKGLFFKSLNRDELDSIGTIREFSALLQYSPTRNILVKGGSIENARQKYDNSILPIKLVKKVNKICDWLGEIKSRDVEEIPDSLKSRLKKAVINIEKLL